VFLHQGEASNNEGDLPILLDLFVDAMLPSANAMTNPRAVPEKSDPGIRPALVLERIPRAPSPDPPAEQSAPSAKIRVIRTNRRGCRTAHGAKLPHAMIDTGVAPPRPNPSF
jgi:hypothetical protein